jgi:hypothetical protein
MLRKIRMRSRFLKVSENWNAIALSQHRTCLRLRELECDRTCSMLRELECDRTFLMLQKIMILHLQIWMANLDEH